MERKLLRESGKVIFTLKRKKLHSFGGYILIIVANIVVSPYPWFHFPQFQLSEANCGPRLDGRFQKKIIHKFQIVGLSEQHDEISHSPTLSCMGWPVTQQLSQLSQCLCSSNPFYLIIKFKSSDASNSHIFLLCLIYK